MYVSEWTVVPRDQVEMFCYICDDDNDIHPELVPGLQILSLIVPLGRCLPKVDGQLRLRGLDNVKFKNPLHADEPVRAKFTLANQKKMLYVWNVTLETRDSVIATAQWKIARTDAP